MTIKFQSTHTKLSEQPNKPKSYALTINFDIPHFGVTSYGDNTIEISFFRLTPEDMDSLANSIQKCAFAIHQEERVYATP